MIDFVIIAGCFFVQLLFVLVDLPSLSYLWQLLIVFAFNGVAALLIYSKLPPTPEPIQPGAANKSPNPHPPEPGSGGNSPKLTQPSPSTATVPEAHPPEAAQKLWDRWCHALETSNPDTLGSQNLERVQALVTRGQRATDQENKLSEREWFEGVCEELWQKVRSKPEATEPMRIFAEMSSELGYSIITTESGARFDAERHEAVGNSGRTSFVDQVLLPGFQWDESNGRWLAIVTLRL